MGGNRNFGFLRGNANGRNGSCTPRKWFCVGCQKDHGGRVERTGVYGLGDYCDRSYLKLKEAQFAAEALARTKKFSQ